MSDDHPLFHCFFDVSLKDGYDIYGQSSSYTCTNKQLRNYLDGLFVGNSLVLLYSEKGYGQGWVGDVQMPNQMGINIFVYALTKAGGKARKFVDMSATKEKTPRNLQYYEYDYTKKTKTFTMMFILRS